MKILQSAIIAVCLTYSHGVFAESERYEFIEDANILCLKEDIIASDAIIFTPLKGKKATASYVTIKNKCKKQLDLVAVEMGVKARIELHEMRHENDRMLMKSVEYMPIKPNGTLRMQRGGDHIMLLDMEEEIKSGDIIKAKLFFNENPRLKSHIEVEVPFIVTERPSMKPRK